MSTPCVLLGTSLSSIISFLLIKKKKNHARGKLKGGGNGDAKLKSLLGNGNGWYLLIFCIFTF